jgi:hypothetical protein
MGDWIDALGNEDELRRKAEEHHRRTHFRRAEIIAQKKPDLWAALMTAIQRDVEKFRTKFAGRRTVDLTMIPEFGFRLYKSPYPTVLLEAEIPPDGTSIKVTYTTVFNHISPTERSEESFELAPDRAENLVISHNGRVFSSLNDVSRFLLEPAFAVEFR